MSAIPNIAFGKLYIKKRTLNEWLALFVFVFNFLSGFLFEFIGISDRIKFSVDVILVYFCVTLFINRYASLKRETRPLFIIFILLIVYTLVLYLFNYQSPFYYIWGARNLFRFYIAFFVFTAYVDEYEAISWLKLVDVIFWIDIFFSLFQFFFLNVRQDYLGGIFGIDGGTNGDTTLFFSIVVSKSFLATFNKQEKIINCVLKCLASLIIAAMAEMKFFFVIFIIILILVSLLTRFSLRKFSMLLVSIVGVILAANLLISWFGFEGFLSFDYIWELATKENYSSAKDLNRLTAIFTLRKTILTEPEQSIFGLGLGNCDFSDLSIFSTPFSQTYGYLNYRWFSAVMIFLETGFLGLGLYFLFFLVCFILALKRLKSGTGNPLFCQLAIVFSLLCFIISFYNASLRNDIAYMVYFILALPFIGSKRQKSTNS